MGIQFYFFNVFIKLAAKLWIVIKNWHRQQKTCPFEIWSLYISNKNKKWIVFSTSKVGFLSVKNIILCILCIYFITFLSMHIVWCKSFCAFSFYMHPFQYIFIHSVLWNPLYASSFFCLFIWIPFYEVHSITSHAYYMNLVWSVHLISSYASDKMLLIISS